jgi:uncharacterized phage protein (TIGR02216 family)
VQMRERKFPWAMLMRFALVDLRMRPCDFWRTTLRELHLCRGESGSALLRDDFDEMTRRFPDE